MADENLSLKLQLEGEKQVQAGLDATRTKVRRLGDETGTAGGKFARADRQADGLRRGLAGVNSQASKTNRGVRIMARGAAYGGAALAAVAAIMGGKVIRAATNMNETVSKSDTTFGAQAAGMRRWAQNSDEALGMSRQQALDAASGFAVYGKSAGMAGVDLGKFSAGLVKNASDLGSFHNASPEETLLAIKSGLAGEAEPLKRFGILMNDATLKSAALKQGLIKTTKEALTPGQKVLAANAVITAQLGDAQGDFLRTSKGAANQQKILEAKSANLQATLGKALLPTWVRLLGVANRFAPKIEKFVLGMQNGTGAGGRFADRMKVVGGYLLGFGARLVVAYKRVIIFRDGVTSAWRHIKSGASSLADGVSGAWSRIQSGFGTMIDWIKAKWDAFATSLNDGIAVANNVPGVDMGFLPTTAGRTGTALPAVGGSSQFTFGGSQPKPATRPAVRMQARPQPGLGARFAGSVAGAGGLGGTTVIPVSIEGREVARAVINHGKRVGARG